MKWDGVVVNMCESYSANDAGNEFTFFLREGLKWNDGQPYTADDVLFWYEDVVMDRDVTPQEPRVPFEVERVDDYTVKWVFEDPQGLFIKDMARINYSRATQYPKQYLQQFHKSHNANAESLAKEANQATWSDMFGAMATQHQNAELPLFWPWFLTTGMGETTTRIVCERNPYYFKVDPEGNQLPYIDRYNYELVADNEVLVLKVLNGEIDFQEQWINDPKNQPVFYDGQEKGGFHFWELTPTYANEFIMMFNRDCTNEMKAEIFANKDFRIGLSLAIDRQELIDVVLVGQSLPHQAAPRPESVYYHERLATQYTEFDVDKANEHLDKAGLSERDAEGFRLGPDGKRFTFIMEIDQGRVTYVDLLELIIPMWAKNVGIEANVKLMERSLEEERVHGRALEWEAGANKFGGGGGEAPILDPRYWFPSGIYGSMFAKRWAAWYEAGPDDEIAEEPPPDVLKMMELYDQIKTVPDEAKQKEMLMELLELAADRFWAIGTVLEPLSFGIVTNRMKNTPESLPRSWIYPTPVPCNTCQFYIEE
jgi:peptide/nickel transport system substrate-binding protein